MILPRLGEPMPRLPLASRRNPSYALDSAAGRWLLLALCPDDTDAAALAAAVAERPALFATHHLAAFAIRPGDAAALPDAAPPGLIWLAETAGALRGAVTRWLLLDPQLRVFLEAAAGGLAEMLATLREQPPPALHAGVEAAAPVLLLPRVFEPALCRALIAQYESEGGGPSGFMRDIEGRTQLVLDARHKTRRDRLIAEANPLHAELRRRISKRLVPEIARAFQFQATRIERYLVACYDAAEHAHFNAHRDNTTLGTAHRRFAVTINLNAEEHEGGDLVFPEFGPRRHRAPTGGAVVFSCSLLHQVEPVTRGRRFAFLPFLYDEAAAAVHEANRRHVDV